MTETEPTYPRPNFLGLGISKYSDSVILWFESMHGIQI